MKMMSLLSLLLLYLTTGTATETTVRSANNNIYFYGAVSESSTLQLKIKLEELDLHSQLTAIHYQIETPPIHLHIQSGASGKFEEIKNEFSNLVEFMQIIKKTYLNHGNISSDNLDALLKQDLWLTSAKSLEYGFVDEIIIPPAPPASTTINNNCAS